MTIYQFQNKADKIINELENLYNKTHYITKSSLKKQYNKLNSEIFNLLLNLNYLDLYNKNSEEYEEKKLYDRQFKGHESFFSCYEHNKFYYLNRNYIQIFKNYKEVFETILNQSTLIYYIRYIEKMKIELIDKYLFYNSFLRKNRQ